jgi:hypothetical protein
MKFLIGRTSDWTIVGKEPPAPGAVRTTDNKAWQIEIADLEALGHLIDTLEEPLILSKRQGAEGLTAIEIYDDMREEPERHLGREAHC